MKNKIKLINIGVFFVVVIVIVLYIVIGLDNSSIEKSDNKSDVVDSGISNEVEMVVKGNSMYPLLNDGEKIIVEKKYYEDNKGKKDEIVIHNYAGEKNPIIKSIKVTSDDKVEIKSEKLYINDKELVNSKGESYNFSIYEIKVLKMYIKNNHIPKNSYFIFGEDINNSIDSRKFGAVGSKDFIGKYKE